MSQNVAESLESRNTSLFEKLASNNDLANVVMGFLGRITIMCHQMGKPIFGVRFGEITESNNEFRFGMTFSDLSLSAPGLWQPQDDLMRYASSKSVHLAKMLESNHQISRTFVSLVDVIDKWCKRKNIPFKDFKLKKAFVHPKTNTCIIRAGIADFGDRFR